MSNVRLKKTGFENGQWTGQLSGTSDSEELTVWSDGKRAEGLVVAKVEGESQIWDVTFPVPLGALGDAAAVFLFRMKGSVEPLETLTLLAGKALDGDPRAELAGLRAELDLIKKVLRRSLAEADADK